MPSKSAFTELPVYKHKDLILQSLRENQVIIVESPTGSGKTTQIPLILKEAGYDREGIIGVTQPRRIAALSICDFIKRQLEIEDNYCAYTMRFADTSDETTRIKVMTDGILLQELKDDRYLSRYSVMMVDEAHERSLNIDFILGLLKQVIEVRPELKVIISSATINTQKFSDFFGGARIISIPTRVYPVTVHYSPIERDEDYTVQRGKKGQRRNGRDADETDLRMERIWSIIDKRLKDGVEGDILVFLPGEYEILQCDDMLRHGPLGPYLQVYPLYGRLSKEDQERVFTPTAPGKVKVVIATNIAETSITIDGIRCVIDSGLAKVNFYDQRTFASALVPQLVSKASAEQRKGRAGRTSPGECYRLYSEESFSSREDFTKEEITRSDLAEVALRMSDLGIYDYSGFPFITAPKKSALDSAEYTLKLFGAIDDDHHLTSTGQMMVRFPLIPRLSRAIVESIMKYPDVLSEVLIAVSFLSTKGPFLFPKDQAMLARSRQERFQDSTYGDFAGYLKLYKAYKKVLDEAESPKAADKAAEKFCKHYFLDLQTMNEIVHIKTQLEEIVSTFGVPITGGGEMSHYFISLGSGLLQFVCIQDDYSSYRSLTVSDIYIHPSCSWFSQKPRYILAGEIVSTSRTFARSVSPLKKEWLDEIYPKLSDLLRYSYSTGYESIEKSYERGMQKAERKAAKEAAAKSAPDERILFGMGFKTKDKGNCVVIPLRRLKALKEAAFTAGSVPKLKAALTVGGCTTLQPIPLKVLIQEAALIEDRKLLESFNDQHYRLEDDHEALADALGRLFTPVGLGKGKLGFLCLAKAKKREGEFKLYASSSLPSCVDTVYLALSQLVEATHGNEKRYRKLRTASEKLLKRLDELEGLDE